MQHTSGRAHRHTTDTGTKFNATTSAELKSDLQEQTRRLDATFSAPGKFREYIEEPAELIALRRKLNKTRNHADAQELRKTIRILEHKAETAARKRMQEAYYEADNSLREHYSNEQSKLSETRSSRRQKRSTPSAKEPESFFIGNGHLDVRPPPLIDRTLDLQIVQDIAELLRKGVEPHEIKIDDVVKAADSQPLAY